METKELQQKLLAYYKKNLADLPEDFLSAQEFIQDRGAEFGLCTTAKKVFKVLSEDLLWTYKYIPFGRAYWGAVPKWAHTTQEIKQALQLRIDILEQILSEND